MFALLCAAALAGVDDPVHTGRSAPDDYAVVVGVESYAFLPDVPHAARDAAAVRTWLVSARGVPPERVELLTDASREQVLAALDRAGEAVGADGTLWVYWAGHGAASATRGERLLLGVDVMADPEVFEARALALSEIDERLDQAPSAVFWADTCYAGVGRDGQPLLQGTRFAVPSYAVEAPEGPRVRWTAAAPGQLSQAHPASGHGAFTWASLRAVQGEADGELDGASDGAVTAAEAQAFVTRTLATEGIRQQTPQLAGDTSFVFAADLPAASPTPAPMAAAPVPRPSLGPVPPPPPPVPERRVDQGRLAVAGVMAGLSVGALGAAVAMRSTYRSAGPEQGSLDGLVVANQVAGWTGIALGVGAVGLGVTAVR